jgi:hypothetical protein
MRQYSIVDCLWSMCQQVDRRSLNAFPALGKLLLYHTLFLVIS